MILTPESIANSLGNVADILQNPDATADEIEIGLKVLRTAARNTRVLFELSAENGQMLPKNAGEVWFLVDMLSQAKAVPSSFDTPEAVFLGIVKAMEIGVNPITALANLMIVNNRISVWGDLAQALVQNSGKMANHVAERIGGGVPASTLELADWPDDYGWRFTAWRKGQDEPFIGEYTVGRARRAKLWNNARKQPWLTDPDRMIFNRARAYALRDGFSDCLFGMGIAEELRDFEPLAAPAAAPALGAPSALDDEPETERPTLADFTERAAPTIADTSALDNQPERVTVDGDKLI